MAAGRCAVLRAVLLTATLSSTAPYHCAQPHGAAALRRRPRASARLALGGTTWRIVLNVGRERGTWMPDEWAASGARLSFPLDVTFLDTPWIEPDTPLPSLLLTPGEPMVTASV